MDMLPKNVPVDDLNALNPFQQFFQSQKIMNGNTQLYPKTSYTLGTKDDTDGTVKVKVNYQYVPMSASYNGGSDKPYTFGDKTITEKQVLTYDVAYKYQIFKQSSPLAFCFMGETLIHLITLKQ